MLCAPRTSEGLAAIRIRYMGSTLPIMGHLDQVIWTTETFGLRKGYSVQGGSPPSTRAVIDFQLPFVLGEVGWTNELSEALPYIARLEELKSLGLLSGSLFWSMFGHAEQYG